MTQSLLPPRSQHDDDGELDRLDSSVSISPRDLFKPIWRSLISKKTALTVILGLSLLTLVGTLLVQAPRGLRDDPQGYASWLDSVRPKYGGWTTVFDKLGFFSMFTSWLYLGTGAVLALSIVACTVNRVPQLWKRSTRPPARKTDTFFLRAPLRAEISAAASVDESVRAVRAALRSRHWRVVDDAGGDPGSLYADRSRWMPFGTIVAHVSLLIILLGGFLTVNTGFRDNQVAVPVGDTVAIGHGTGLTIEAKSFTDAYYADGSPKDYASDLVLYKDGKVVDSRTVRVNHPMRWGGVSIFQSFFGVAASMTVRADDGSVLYQHGVPLVWTSSDGTHSIGKFTMPDQDLTVYVVTPASGQPDPEIKAGQAQIEVYQGTQDAPVDVQVLDPGKPVTSAGLRFTFERSTAFTGLIVSRDRGVVFVWIGCVLLALGSFLVLFFPHRRVWVQVRETDEGTVVRAAAQRREALKRDTAFESGFQRLAHDLQHAVTNTSTTRK